VTGHQSSGSDDVDDMCDRDTVACRDVAGKDFHHMLATFDETKSVVGFDEYYVEEDRYRIT
jgi:hypothetical protein